MSDAIAITALGMVTSLGHGAIASCAAARAGLSSPGALKVMTASFSEETPNSPSQVIGHAVPAVGTGFTGAGKVIALGAAAIQDLFSRVELSARERMRTSLHLAISDSVVEDAAQRERARLEEPDDDDGDPLPPEKVPSVEWRERSGAAIERLAAKFELPLAATHRTLHDGSPGLADALREAASRLAGGSVDRALVGAVDSRVDPRFLLAAAEVGVLRTNVMPVGLIPGEAAAFFLLERARDARAPLALVVSVSSAREPSGHFDDARPTGRALAQAIQGALAGHAELGGALAFTLGDLNGAERRSLDWGTALVRLRQAGGAFDFPLWLPALAFGDTGAASGAVAVCLAARAFERGYAPGRGAIVWLSSESGAAAAIGLTAPGR